MPNTQPLEFDVLEDVTTQISFVLTREDGVSPVPGSILTSFILTILSIDPDADPIVGPLNVLQANNHIVGEDGQVIGQLVPSQVVIQDQTLPFERHVLQYLWTWGQDPPKQGRQEIALILRNLDRVP